MTNDKIENDTQRALDDIGNRVAGAFTLGNNSEMYKVVEEYKQEMLHWFTKGDLAHENPMKRATQEHWYNLYLGKKRLENHRLQIQYEEYKHVIKRPTQEEPSTVYNYRTDGKYTICMANQYTRVRKKYIRNGSIIGQEQQDYEIDYYITRAQNKDGLYICPSCGAEQTLDKLLDGCDYCQSKFDISAYDDKVMSVMKSTNLFNRRETTSGQETTTAISVLLVIFGFPAVFFGLLCAPVTLGLSLVVALAGGIALYFCFKLVMDNYKKAFQVVYRLQDHNPGFSEESFIGSLDCKLKAIHYASNPQELAAFMKCDIAPYLKNYQNVVDCETGRISYKKFQIQGDYQYVELHREIKVMMDCGNQLKPASGVVKVVLAKKLSHKLKNDVVLYRCNSCGASISLVEGGKCKYCDNEMDYAAYDWVVVQYQHVQSI